VILGECRHSNKVDLCYDTIGLFSDSVLNVRKHIFERKHRKSSRKFSSIVNK